MSITEYANRFGFKLDDLKRGNYWSEFACKDNTWINQPVNFYTLLINAPLWKFNELYQKWYAAKNENNDAGPMGDFMDDTPTDEQIKSYLTNVTINFN